MSQFNRLHSTEDLEKISSYISEHKPYQPGTCKYKTRYECKNSCSIPAHTRPATLVQNYSTVQKQEVILNELSTRVFNTGIQRKASLDELLKGFGRKERPLENAIFEQERKKDALEASTAENLRILRARLISSDEHAELRAVIYVAEERWKTVQAKVEYEMKDLKAQTDESHERLTRKYKSTLTELETLAEDARVAHDEAWKRIDEDVRWYREEQASTLLGKCQSPF
jgi:galactokinase